MPFAAFALRALKPWRSPPPARLLLYASQPLSIRPPSARFHVKFASGSEVVGSTPSLHCAYRSFTVPKAAAESNRRTAGHFSTRSPSPWRSAFLCGGCQRACASAAAAYTAPSELFAAGSCAACKQPLPPPTTTFHKMATLAQGQHCAHSSLVVPSQCMPALSRRSAVSFAGRSLPSAGTRSSASAAGRQSQPVGRQSRSCTAARAQAGGEASVGQQPSGRIITGTAYVLEDNIDTDQIIPAEYLTLVPSVPEEYEKLGSYALAGLPEQHTTRYVTDGEMKMKYPIIVAGANFGCGSSREHAPVALGAAGCRAVVAESYARIFFRNCVATGELYPVESAPLEGSNGERLCDVVKTGDTVTVDLEHDLLIHVPSGQQFALRPIGEAGPVIDAGGIFNYARQTGMIPTKA